MAGAVPKGVAVRHCRHLYPLAAGARAAAGDAAVVAPQMRCAQAEACESDVNAHVICELGRHPVYVFRILRILGCGVHWTVSPTGQSDQAAWQTSNALPLQSHLLRRRRC